MKVLFVLGSFFPAQSGGPNNSVYWISKALVKQGVQVSVATLKDGLTSADVKEYSLIENSEARIEGIRATYFGYLFSRYLSFKMMLWLIRNIKSFDIVNLNSVFFPYTWLAALICIIYRVPFIISPRGELEPGALSFKKYRKLFFIYSLAMRYLLRARLILTTSDQEKLYVNKFLKGRVPIKVFPNYISVVSEDLTRSEIVSKSDILFLGRLHPKKGIENLIQAYEILHTTGITHHNLIIAGQGDTRYEKDLKNLVLKLNSAQNIKFVGHVTGQDKRQFLIKSRVMVLPSFSENFGNVVLEALSAYTPVIASKFTPWEVLEEYNCGLIGKNDPNSIANFLTDLLNKDDVEYSQMAYNARILATSKFDVSENISKLINIYDELCPVK